MNEIDVFARVIEDYGPPQDPVVVSAETVEAFRDRLPKELIDFWLTYGWGNYKNGQFRLCDPRPFDPMLELIFKDDLEFDAKNLTVVGFTAFATLRIWFRTGRTMLVHLQRSELFAPALSSAIDPGTGRSYSQARLSGLLIYNELSIGILEDYTEACEKLGRPDPDEVFGYVPALQLGGEDRLDNLHRLKAIEHMTFLAQLGPLMLTELTGPLPDAPMGRMRNVRRLGPR